MNRLATAFEAIDAANSADPNRDSDGEREWPKEALYSRRMSDRLGRYAPEASEELRIAVRAQHIRRWTIPRGDFPMTRAGYIKWRTTLGKFHASETARIMSESGYDAVAIAKVESLLRKENLKGDPEAQTLEDVICLVFLEHYLDDFAKGQTEEKIVSILQKTWRKVSERGRAAAMELSFSEFSRRLIERALA